MNPEEKVDAAVRMLKAQGHAVETQVCGGKFWFEIDYRMLVSWEEMQNLADGVHSLTELEELFKRRRAEEAAKCPDEAAEGVVKGLSDLSSAGLPANLAARALGDLAWGYLSAKQNTKNWRNALRAVRRGKDDPDSAFGGLLNQAANRERAAREVFVNAYRDYWTSMKRLQRGGGL